MARRIQRTHTQNLNNTTPTGLYNRLNRRRNTHTHTHTHTEWKPEAKNPTENNNLEENPEEQQPEEKPEDFQHTTPQTTHPPNHRQHNLISRPPNYPSPQYLPRNWNPTSHCPLDIQLNKLTVTRNDDEISASPRNIDIYIYIYVILKLN